MFESFISTLVFVTISLNAASAFAGAIFELTALFGGTPISFIMALVVLVGGCLLVLEGLKRYLY
ncbi:MAG: hypothetical protein H9W81_07620 [Enterococcus sp.]|nr:hypothetical protein [Enterococcus sp.]